jgi:plastocyanin domain-containing protein
MQSSSSDTLNMTATSQAYSPQVIQAKAGQAYRLVIDSKDNRGCGRSVVIPALNLQATLSENGQTVIDLPAQKAGTLRITCIMGMYNSKIQYN